jgi:predicted RNA-binding protein with PIN domain
VSGVGEPRTVVLVDGSNVLRSAAWGDPADSRRLVDRVAGWAAMEGLDVLLAFDGAIERSRPVGHVLVMATGAQEADDVLAERAARLVDRGIDHWVVSDDHGVRGTAGAGAQRVLGTAAFVALLAEPEQAARHDSSTGAERPGSRIADALDDDARARLERLRRGR